MAIPWGSRRLPLDDTRAPRTGDPPGPSSHSHTTRKVDPSKATAALDWVVDPVDTTMPRGSTTDPAASTLVPQMSLLANSSGVRCHTTNHVPPVAATAGTS